MTPSQSLHAQPPPPPGIAIVEDEDDVGTWSFYECDSATSDLVGAYRNFFYDIEHRYDEWDELSVSGLRTPATPISPSPGNSTPALTSGGFPIRYGRATILTAPPKLVAIVETLDVAVGAVDPRRGGLLLLLGLARELELIGGYVCLFLALFFWSLS